MPTKISASAKEAGLFLRRNWQVAYAILLIILVPTTIVINTVFVVNRFRTTVDVEIQRSAQMIGRMFQATSSDLYDDQAALQARLETVAQSIPEVRMIDILAKDGEDFKVYASLYHDGIGRAAHGNENILAWYNNHAVAFSTKSARSASTSAQLTAEEMRGSERYWGVIMPLTDANGDPKLLLSAKYSLSVVDKLVSSNLFWSYAWLMITVLVVVLLLAANSRLFEYAVLFRRLKEVDKMKDDFISMASHELRAPITAIRGYLSLFLDGAFGPLEEKPKGIIKTTFGISTHLAGLVEDLLDVSRIEQGRMSMSLEAVAVEEMCAEVFDQLKYEAERKGLAFEYRRPAEPLPIISADKARLRQVLINLTSNAIKYTPKGSVIITTEKHEGNLVEIKVTDTGLGMSPEARAKLFEKFYRVRTDDTRDIPGTGLGLWITKQIVEIMRGHIYVDSIERVGTQATVAFPAVVALDAPTD